VLRISATGSEIFYLNSVLIARMTRRFYELNPLPPFHLFTFNQVCLLPAQVSLQQLLFSCCCWLESQGCQMVCFQTKNPNLGKFWRVYIFYDHLVYFTAIGNTLWPFGLFCGHLVYFPPLFWYFVPRKIWQPWVGGGFTTENREKRFYTRIPA
jgi:hypothetical protein